MPKHEFDIKRNSRGYIIIRNGKPYTFHAHVSTMNGCRLLIKLIHENRLPTSKYLQGSARRLLTEDEYSQLRAKKQRYVNVNRGVRNT